MTQPMQCPLKCQNNRSRKTHLPRFKHDPPLFRISKIEVGYQTLSLALSNTFHRPQSSRSRTTIHLNLFERRSQPLHLWRHPLEMLPSFSLLLHHALHPPTNNLILSRMKCNHDQPPTNLQTPLRNPHLEEGSNVQQLVVHFHPQRLEYPHDVIRVPRFPLRIPLDQFVLRPLRQAFRRRPPHGVKLLRRKVLLRLDAHVGVDGSDAVLDDVSQFERRAYSGGCLLLAFLLVRSPFDDGLGNFVGVRFVGELLE
mmetsp:Transcript_24133/g.50535  ORF Transcript_24133/g.50535 Transcript_24133/m.50535 type:complete len:254 (+) Transcript_24133:347-1108(+)